MADDIITSLEIIEKLFFPEDLIFSTTTTLTEVNYILNKILNKLLDFKSTRRV